MRRKTALLILMLLNTAAALGAAPDTLRVMSYNIRFGELATMDEIAAAINGQSPDFVMLQECDWATGRAQAPRQNGICFVNELARGTNSFGLYGKTISFAGGYYGIGMLSRHPVVSSRRVMLPDRGDTEPRCILIADVELPSGRIVTIACTHLEVSAAAIRLSQAGFINELLRDNPYPVILAGDMNAVPESDEIALLRSEWTDCSSGCGFTFSSKKPSLKIDYIFTKPSGSFTTAHSETLSQYRLSDHLPLSCTLIIENCNN